MLTLKKVGAGLLGLAAGFPAFAQEGGSTTWDFADAKTAISGMGAGVSDLFLGQGGVLTQYKTVLLAVGSILVVAIVFGWIFSAARRKR